MSVSRRTSLATCTAAQWSRRPTSLQVGRMSHLPGRSAGPFANLTPSITAGSMFFSRRLLSGEVSEGVKEDSEEKKPWPELMDVTDPIGMRYFKLKNRHKRAGGLINRLHAEEMEKIKASKSHLPPFQPGDAVDITWRFCKSDPRPYKDRGIVIKKTNKGLNSSVTIRNVAYGDAYERTYMYNSPLVENIEIYQKAFIHEGKKRVRRAKLYYLRDKELEFSTVSKKGLYSNKVLVEEGVTDDDTTKAELEGVDEN